MTESVETAGQDTRPPLMKDRSFWGLNLTQFLGAFNDNLFKQLVMLLCLDQVHKGGKDLQGLAMALFAVPFIIFSGYAGFLSDRYEKRRVIVLCKVAEVCIVILGMIGFFTHSLTFLLGVLCLMGVHSAFFGPSKYGILPEMLRAKDLPHANGMVLMATFLAIIFGLSAAGAAKQQFSNTLWIASLPCLVIAVTGLITSLMIRRTPVAQPALQLETSSLVMAPDTRTLLRENRTLLGVLTMSSVFWFVGGTIYPPAINALSKEQFRFNDMITGFFAASTGVGIAIGCILAGVLSKDRVRGWIVRMGAWGLVASLAVLAIPGPGWNAVHEDLKAKKLEIRAQNDSTSTEKAEKEPLIANADSETDEKPAAKGTEKADANPAVAADPFYRGTMLGPYGSAAALICVGLFAGFYSVPLSVYLQTNAPTEQKGRIIAANNLLNWIGIAGAGAIYSLGRIILVQTFSLPQASLFGFAAVLMLPVALFYRPPNTKVEGTNV